MTQKDNQDTLIWQRFIQAYNAYITARRDVVQQSNDLNILAKSSFNNLDERGAFVDILKYLTADQKIEIFDTLLTIGSNVHGHTTYFHECILSIPKQWLLENIETKAERLLKHGTYEEYRAIYEIYRQLDRDLVARLAHRASLSDDPDIKEAGDDMFEWLNSSST
jgi:hypothetical protein